jgi:hypothetical protein
VCTGTAKKIKRPIHITQHAAAAGILVAAAVWVAYTHSVLFASACEFIGKKCCRFLAGRVAHPSLPAPGDESLEARRDA